MGYWQERKEPVKQTERVAGEAGEKRESSVLEASEESFAKRKKSDKLSKTWLEKTQ